MNETKNRNEKRGVFVIIIIYVSVLTSLVVLFCAGVYYSSMSSYLKKQIEISNATYLKQLSSSYELFLENTIDSSMLFIENDIKNVMSLANKNEDEYKKQMYRHLESISGMTGFIDSVYFYDKDTEMIYLSSGISYEVSDFYDSAWLDSLKENRKAWEILSARQLKAPLENKKNIVPILIRYPFASLERPYLYVINLRADQLFKYLLNNNGANENKNYKVINDTQNIFISSDSQDDFKNIEDFPYLFANKSEMESKKQGCFVAKKENKRILVHYVSSDQYEWLYLSEMDYSVVVMQLKEPLILIVILTVMILVVSFLLCIVFAKRLYKPVRNLIGFLTGKTVGERNNKKQNEYEILKEYISNASSENKILKDTLIQNSEILNKQFFYNLLAKNYYSKEEIDKHFEELGLHHDSAFIVTLFSVDEKERYMEVFNREERSLWEYAFENIACEVADKYGKSVFVGVDSNRFALIFTFDNLAEKKDLEATIKDIADKIMQELQKFIHFTFSAGIGMVSQSVYTVDKSYEQARAVILFLEDSQNKYMTFREMQGANRNLQYSYDNESKLMEIVKSGDGKQAGEFLLEMYNEFRKSNNARKDGQSYFVFLIMTAIMKQGNELGFSLEEIFSGHNVASLWEISVERKDEKEMLQELQCIMEVLCNQIISVREGVTNSQVLHITEFIKDNYPKPITLRDIAEHVGVNQSTVSRLMTQNLKMSTVDCINQVRISQALELISKGRKKVSEISQEVGFHNAHYFIRVFKKITGKTPGTMIDEMSKNLENDKI